jgi:HSP20 family protein
MTLVKNNHEAKEFIPRTFSDIIDNFFNETSSKVVKFLPSVDVVEDEKTYEIHVAIPGIKKEEIKIEFQEGKLSISGERKFEKHENNGKKYHTVETQYGAFKRSFYLPDNIDFEKINAEYIDGILKITVPKDQKKITKTTIEVK